MIQDDSWYWQYVIKTLHYEEISLKNRVVRMHQQAFAITDDTWSRSLKTFLVQIYSLFL